MADVLVEFAEPVTAKDGRTFMARAFGSELDGNLWQGWLEFVPLGGGRALRSGRETTQPNRVDTEYWATGLTPVYLEGALERAMNPPPRGAQSRSLNPAVSAPDTDTDSAPTARESVLNPFSVYRKGEALLRSQLLALSGWHLVNIVEAYGLSDQSSSKLASTPAAVLVELIVSAVRERTLTGTA